MKNANHRAGGGDVKVCVYAVWTEQRVVAWSAHVFTAFIYDVIYNI